MSYTKEDSIFPFNEQENKNFIIYGVNVPYNSFEEGEEIYEKVMDEFYPNLKPKMYYFPTVCIR